MKIAAILAFLAVSAQAELKWETVRQTYTYQKGQPILKGTFGFTNKGKVPVKLTSVKSGCACCTSAKADKKVFAPGERGAIAVRVNVQGKQLPLIKPVVIGTDDGKFTTLLVEVKTADGQTVTVPKWGK